MKITATQHAERVEANQDSVFFKYLNESDAMASYSRKYSNPRFNNDELFMYEVENLGWVVQTTGSLVKA